MKQKKKTKTRTIFHTDVYIYLRHTFQPTPIPYRYRFQTPDSSHYYAASFELKLENLEGFMHKQVENILQKLTSLLADIVHSLHEEELRKEELDPDSG